MSCLEGYRYRVVLTLGLGESWLGSQLSGSKISTQLVVMAWHVTRPGKQGAVQEVWVWSWLDLLKAFRVRHMNGKAPRSTETHRKKAVSRLHEVSKATTYKSHRVKEEKHSHRAAAEVDVSGPAVKSWATIRKLKLVIQDWKWSRLLEESCWDYLCHSSTPWVLVPETNFNPSKLGFSLFFQL